MNQRLQIDRSDFGLRRVHSILRRQIMAAIAALRRSHGGDEKIHHARKQMKAARATLRLLRPALSERTFEREKRLLRDAGRAIGPTRDNRVLERTLGETQRRALPKAAQPAIKGFAARLRRQAQAVRSEALREGMRRSREYLEQALGNSASWPSLPRASKPVRRGLGRTYRQGRRIAKSNARHASAESHEWRKRSKDLRSQLEVIAPLQHATLQKMAGRLHALTDELGEEHDLAVLRQRLEGAGAGLRKSAREALEERIAERRAKLRRKALKAGKKAYAERPARFAARLRAYFRRWSD